jgi:hypothetical protein
MKEPARTSSLSWFFVAISSFYPSVENRSLLGNPFKIGKDGTRREVTQRYRIWLLKQIKRQGAVYRELKRLAAIARQCDIVLICWCKERDRDVDCHGEVIRSAVEFLNSPAGQLWEQQASDSSRSESLFSRAATRIVSMAMAQ